MTPANPHLASPPQPGNVHTQLSLWTAAGLAGMVTGMLLARRPFFESLIKGFGPSNKRRVRPPSGEQSLAMLATAILGSSKATVQSVLGAPRSAFVPQVGVVVHPRYVYWQSDTWYYPLGSKEPVALAIGFEDQIASKVEFFTAPSLTPQP